MSDRVSVILPAWNREVFVKDAIDSVLGQELPDGYEMEIIVVIDDSSNDRTEEIARSYEPGVRVIHQAPNLGLGEARNTGMAEASGLFFAFLDIDDVWHPAKLATQLDYLESHPDIAAVFTHQIAFEGHASPEELRAFSADPSRIRSGNTASTFLARMEVWPKAGHFNGDLRVGEFVDWFGRAKSAGVDFHTLQEALVYRRSHENNMTRLAEAEKSDYLKLLKSRLDAKRGGGGQRPGEK